MRVYDIVTALNHYYINKFPNCKGWFIAKESIEPTRLNAYKKYKIEIYYHIPGRNELAYTQQVVDRCPEGCEEELKTRILTKLVTDLFINLQDLDKYASI